MEIYGNRPNLFERADQGVLKWFERLKRIQEERRIQKYIGLKLKVIGGVEGQNKDRELVFRNKFVTEA